MSFIFVTDGLQEIRIPVQKLLLSRLVTAYSLAEETWQHAM